MNKNEFIKELEKRLKYIPADDRTDAIEYYREYLGEMDLSDTDDVSGVIESPREVAGKIIDECTEKHINEQNESKSLKSSATVVWLTVLGILSLPLSVPVIIVAATLLIVFLVLIISAFISFIAAALGCCLGGFVCIGTSILSAGIGQKLVVLGVGLMLLAAGLAFVLIDIGMIRLIAYICTKMFGKKKERR